MSLLNYHNKITMILCLILFSYQIYDLLTDYLGGHNVVNIEISQQNYDRLPSFTICFRTLVIDKLAKINDEYMELYKQLSGNWKNNIDIIYNTHYKLVNDLYNSYISFDDLISKYTIILEDNLNIGIWIREFSSQNNQLLNYLI